MCRKLREYLGSIVGARYTAPVQMIIVGAVYRAPTRFFIIGRVTLIFTICLFFTACTSLPAKTPPQLDDTPGPFLIVEETTLQTAAYWVDAPADWKIVKSSIASAPIVIVFASPDDEMIITVSGEPLPEKTPEADTVYKQDDVTLSNGETIHISGQTPNDEEAAFQEIFSEVRGSIRVPEEE